MEKKQGIGFYEKYLTIWDTRSYPDMVNDLPDDAKSGFSKR